MKKKGNFSMEYMIVVALVVTACVGMFTYLSRAVSGRWRAVGDTFGHGRQYGDACGGGEVLCWEVTVRAKYGGDLWDKDMPDLCKDDPCDPENHCWAGDKADARSAVCPPGAFTGLGSSQAVAEANARTAAETKCPNHPGSKASCPEACRYAGPVFLGGVGIDRQGGATGHLCMSAVSATKVCAATCPSG